MKKIFTAIKLWWKYVVLKEEHSETSQVYGKAINKKNNVYYYRDTFQHDYVGTKIIRTSRINRTFVRESEYLANIYND